MTAGDAALLADGNLEARHRLAAVVLVAGFVDDVLDELSLVGREVELGEDLHRADVGMVRDERLDALADITPSVGRDGVVVGLATGVTLQATPDAVGAGGLPTDRTVAEPPTKAVVETLFQRPDAVEDAHRSPSWRSRSAVATRRPAFLMCCFVWRTVRSTSNSSSRSRFAATKPKCSPSSSSNSSTSGTSASPGRIPSAHSGQSLNGPHPLVPLSSNSVERSTVPEVSLGGSHRLERIP
ncbi:hypothetical protein [Haloplanus litoreus]|uniref:hypothetical protein n=1 Tax=Haloplanus litoreus TaxID=767515 RepID=UPI0036D374A3